MIKELFNKLLSKVDLNLVEAKTLLDEIMNGNVNNSLLAGILTAMRLKGVTSMEIAGFVKAMREKSLKFDINNKDVIDVCGTGGDNSGTFNISTAVAFVVAGVGVKVAKHGNRSISSKSGSADVLEQLGVNINLPLEASKEAIDKIGITFLFAPSYHPAMKYVANVRKELAIRTIFNMLGPLTNPALVNKQMIGVFSNEAAKLMAEASMYLNFEKVCFVCCEDKYDEILLNGVSNVFEYNGNGKINNYAISNESFGYTKVNLIDIKGGSAETNANIIRDIFSGKKTKGCFTTVTANAAMALYCSNFSKDLMICKNAAEESILSGKAKSKLEQLIELSNNYR